MTDKDLFGLDREQRILRSGVRDVFTPHRPIESAELFFGRQEEVQKLIEQMNTPGQHSLLYGDRGVGKSSLARISSDLLLTKLRRGMKQFVFRCDSSTRFEDIVRQPFEDAGGKPLPHEATVTEATAGSGELNLGIVKAGGTGETTRSQTSSWESGGVQPSIVATTVGTMNGLLIVDEADAIPASADKKKLAELIKLLSDAGATFKILVVGIAKSGDELTGAHPSVQRCLKETKLRRMSAGESQAIILGGAAKLGLVFDPEVIERIVELSAGYPHFTHLLALKCAEEAVASDRKKVAPADLDEAMRRAVSDAEGTLKRVYDDATRSYATPNYQKILFSAARLNKAEFTADELRRQFEKDHGHAMNQEALNNYFQRLVSDGEATVLRRLAKGVYRFNDPRMPSYVRIAYAVGSKDKSASDVRREYDARSLQ